ncbi:thiopeptide-type bacteriocin biosynthesis protein [Acrocarpospora catenulata]|uniref:thiopeptide-type bacteriocin biosynthesis protein n=1 Tax=Acrocarpospora catenulata TaxID=2836182 RepID=UPI001BDA8815|nr:thiopeptide-type bacteriocin biosynthesis protein [Acrocarpospora catenulata]
MDRLSPWRQIAVTFTDRHAAEQYAFTHLGPVLLRIDTAALVRSWFFIRKQQWRVRYQPADDAADEVRDLFKEAVNRLRATRHVSHCAETIYEPESHAFGGELGMVAAHTLFHHDSRHIFAQLARLGEDQPVQRRELSVLLCTALMRAAGLDWFEWGDVWARVVQLRPSKEIAPLTQGPTFQSAVERLLTADTSTASDLRTGPLVFAGDWLSGFERAGCTLRALAEEGRLSRGIRAVIAHHVIFHWNRMGIPYHIQANLSQAAKSVVFND